MIIKERIDNLALRKKKGKDQVMKFIYERIDEGFELENPLRIKNWF